MITLVPPRSNVVPLAERARALAPPTSGEVREALLWALAHDTTALRDHRAGILRSLDVDDVLAADRVLVDTHRADVGPLAPVVPLHARARQDA